MIIMLKDIKLNSKNQTFKKLFNSIKNLLKLIQLLQMLTLDWLHVKKNLESTKMLYKTMTIF